MNNPQTEQSITVEGLTLLYQRLGQEIHRRIEEGVLRRRAEADAQQVRETAQNMLAEQARAATPPEPTPIEAARSERRVG